MKMPYSAYRKESENLNKWNHYNRMMLRYLSPMIVVLCLLLSCSGESGQSGTPEMDRTLDYTAHVYFHAADDTVAVLKAAVADTDEERSAGLMNVRDMPSDSGMLFLFDNETERSFWMANTPLSLDIIFVNSDMEIVRIQRDTQPYSQRNVLSGAPARYVVETHAGYTLQHDIQEGMAISFEL